jgi:hypothetical protein
MSVPVHTPAAPTVATAQRQHEQQRSCETLQNGSFRDGVFEVLSAAKESGRSVTTRMRIGPFGKDGLPFVVDTSKDRVPALRRPTM